MMKWFGGIVSALLVLILLALGVGPALVDWTAYRGQVADRLRDLTGIDLEIGGAIDVTLLPVPEISIGGLTAPAPAPGFRDLEVRWLRARLKLIDLLAGKATITRLSVVEPDFVVDIDAMTSGVPMPTGQGAEAGPESRIVQGRAVSNIIETDFLEIRQGRIAFMRGGRLLGTEMGSVSGTVDLPGQGRRAAGKLSMEIGGVPVSLDFRTTRIWNGEDGPVTLRLSEERQDLRLTFDGAVETTATGAMLTGNAAVRIGQAAQAGGLIDPLFLAASAPDATAALSAAIQADLSRGIIQMPRIQVDAGPVAGEGAITTILRAESDANAADLHFRFSRLDLDRFLEAAHAKAVPDDRRGADGGAAPGQSQEGQAPAIADNGPITPDRLLRAIDWDMSVALSAAGARFRGSLLREIALRANLEEGALTIQELTVQMPGAAELSVAGFGDFRADDAALEGNATLRADDFRRFLEWAGLPVPDVAPDRLRRFSLVSGITFAGRRLDILDAAVEMDGVSAQASAAVILRDRPAVGLRLLFDRLNLDPYRPHRALRVDASETRPSAAEGNPTGSVSDTAPDQGLSLLRNLDASIEIGANVLVVAALPIRNLATKAVITGGRLLIDEIRFADAGGLAGTVTGSIGLAAAPANVDLRLSAVTGDPGQFAAALGAPDLLATRLRAMGRSTVTASVTGSAERAGEVAINGEGGQGLMLTLAAPAAEPRIQITAFSLASGALAVEGGAGTVEFGGPGYAFRDFTGEINGGTGRFDAALTPGANGLSRLEARLSLNGVALDHALGDLGGPIRLDGSFDLSGAFTATGHDWRGMGLTNQGRFDLAGRGALALPRDRAGLFLIEPLRRLRDDLRRDFSGDGTAGLQGAVVLEDGVLTAQDVTLSRDAATIVVEGRYDTSVDAVSGTARYRRPAAGDTGQKIEDVIAVTGRLTAPDLKLSGASLRPRN